MSNPLQIQITPEQRQKLMSHPDYNKLMGEAVAAIKVDAGSIPPEMHQLVMNILAETPLPALNNMDFETYCDIINKQPTEYGVGVLQKCCDMIVSKEPKFFDGSIVEVRYNQNYLQSYINIIKPYHDLFNECSALLIKARDKVTNTLWMRERIATK